MNLGPKLRLWIANIFYKFGQAHEKPFRLFQDCSISVKQGFRFSSVLNFKNVILQECHTLKIQCQVTQPGLAHWHSAVSAEFDLHSSLASLLHLAISNDVNEVTGIYMSIQKGGKADWICLALKAFVEAPSGRRALWYPNVHQAFYI